VLGSDLQRGGTHARHRPTISGAACAGVCGLWRGFFRALAAGRPRTGGRGVRAQGRGAHPAHPAHPLRAYTRRALDTRIFPDAAWRTGPLF